MPSRRYHTTGQSKPHVVATGYRYESDPNAKLARHPDRRFNRVVIAVMVVVTGYAVGVLCGWLPNVVGLVL